jgi:predicted dehydrogenase
MRLAVIGTGVIGRLRAETVREHPEVSLVGVADVDRVSAVKVGAENGAPPFGEYRQMIDELSPDGVIISSPVTLHEEMCSYALSRGCHVMVEKPLSNSAEACRRIARAATEAQRTLAVGFNHRFFTAIQYVKGALEASRIGDIDHIRVFGGHDGLHNFRADWMFQSELSGGGCMMDVGLHMTDLTRYIAGEIVSVYGTSTNTMWRVPGSEDNAMVIMKSARGFPVVYQSTWSEWRGFRLSVDVYGTRGMARAFYAPMFNMLITQDRPGAARKRSVEFYPEIVLREKLRGWQSTAKRSFADELREFVLRVRGEPAPNLATGWDGIRANEIAEAVYRSTAEDRVVALTPAPGVSRSAGNSTAALTGDAHATG